MAYAKILETGLAIANTKLDPTWTQVVELPETRTFRGAFTLADDKVVVDLERARAIAHEKRRAKRDAEFVPLDREFTYQPEVAEPKRQTVRDENASLQANIDAATTVEELEVLVNDSIYCFVL